MNDVLTNIGHLYTKEMCMANTLEVTAGTTGYCGGDTGHGSRTYLALNDLSSTDMRIRITDGTDVVYEGSIMGRKLEIGFGGDCELSTFASALEYALKIYEKGIRENEEIQWVRRGEEERRV